MTERLNRPIPVFTRRVPDAYLDQVFPLDRCQRCAAPGPRVSAEPRIELSLVAGPQGPERLVFVCPACTVKPDTITVVQTRWALARDAVDRRN